MGDVAAREQDLQIEGITLRVRESGDLSGQPVLHFHGTPGCRLEMAWADHLLADAGVRWIAFDRPGYGGSTSTAFSVVFMLSVVMPKSRLKSPSADEYQGSSHPIRSR